MTVYVLVLDQCIFFLVVKTNIEGSFIKIYHLTLNLWCLTIQHSILLHHNSNFDFEYRVSNNSLQSMFITTKLLCAQSSMNVGTHMVKKFLTLQEHTNIPCPESFASFTSYVHGSPT
jgi:hypothetical protein